MTDAVEQRIAKAFPGPEDESLRVALRKVFHATQRVEMRFMVMAPRFSDFIERGGIEEDYLTGILLEELEATCRILRVAAETIEDSRIRIEMIQLEREICLRSDEQARRDRANDELPRASGTGGGR